MRGAVPLELRVALRNMARAPGHTAALVVTLALGIGATTAIFSVVYGVLYRPLPYPDSGSLVVVEGEKDFEGGITVSAFSAAELHDWFAAGHAFETLAMHGGEGLTLDMGDGIEPVVGRSVSPAFFATLGLPMALGRPLGDDVDPVVVLSHPFWATRFGADATIVGRQVTLSGRAYTVVGVASPQMRFPSERVEVFLPFGHAAALQPERFTNRNRGGFQVIARLRRDVTLPQAREAAAAVVRVLAPHFVESRQGLRPRVTKLPDYVTAMSDVIGNRRSVKPTLLVLLAAVSLALLVACANAANLVMARQSARARDLAVRAALGAGRRRLALESLTESLVLVALGGTMGVGLAMALVRVLPQSTPLPRLDDIAVDAPVLLFALGASMVAVVLAGLAPVLGAGRVHVQSVLRAGGPSIQSTTLGRRLRALFVVSQLAVSVVLLVGALLLARSLDRLLATDIGVSRGNVLTAYVDLSVGRSLPPSRQLEIATAIEARLAALPAIEAVGVGTGLPPSRLRLRQSFSMPSPVDGQPAQHMVAVVPASPGYFEALRVRLLRGRLFTASDGEGAPEVVVITAAAARRLFGERDAIGRTLPISLEEPEAPVTVVGVVADVKYTSIDADAGAVLYRPFSQIPFAQLYLVARTLGDPAAVAPDLRAAVRSVDPGASVQDIRSLDGVVADAVAQPRFRMMLFVAISGLGLVLAVLGLYGVVAYSVTQRTPEIGVRMAVGASPSDVRGLVLREAATLALAGAGIGLVLAYLFTGVLRSLLFDIGPTDVTSFVLAAAGLVGLSLTASYLPARRAMRVDPAVALRAE